MSNAHYKDFYLDDKQFIQNMIIDHDNQFIILESGSYIKILDKKSKALRWHIDQNHINHAHSIFNPHNQTIISTVKTVKEDGVSIIIWSFKEQKLLHKIPLPMVKYINQLQLSADGRTLIALSSFKDYLYIIDIDRAEISTVLISDEKLYSGNAISHDGHYLANSRVDNTIELRDLNSQSIINILYGHSSYVWHLAFTSDNNYLISGANDGDIRLWSVKNGQLIHHFHAPKPIYSMAISPDNRYLAATIGGQQLSLLDLREKKWLKTINVPKNEQKSNHLIDFIDHKTVLFSNGFLFSTWDLDTDAISEQRNHHNHVRQNTHSLILSHDDRYLITGMERDARIQIWDRHTNALVSVLRDKTLANNRVNNSVNYLLLSPDSRYLFAAIGDMVGGGEGIVIQMWDMQHKTLVHTFKSLNDRANISHLAITPDGRYLGVSLFVYIEGKPKLNIELWDTVEKKLVHTITEINDKGHYAHQFFCFALAGDYLFIADDNGTLIQWHVQARKVTQRIKVTDKKIDTISCMPDDKHLLIAAEDQLHLWNAESHRIVKTFAVRHPPISNLITSQDGKTIVAYNGFFIEIWHTTDKNARGEIILQRKYANYYTPVTALTQDGKQLIIGFENEAVKSFALDHLTQPSKIFMGHDTKNWFVFDEINKKLYQKDTRKLLMQKQLTVRDEWYTVYRIMQLVQ